MQLIARESEINAQLRQIGSAESHQQPAEGAPLLGDLLIEAGLIDRQIFDHAMLNYQPQHHGRIGDYLVDLGVLPRTTIEQVVARQHRFVPTESTP